MPGRHRYSHRRSAPGHGTHRGENMILVTGATGNIGRELVRLLVAAGAKIRVMTRDPKKVEKLGAAVEVFQGDLDRPEVIAQALRGVDKLFLLAAGTNVPGAEANAID